MLDEENNNDISNDASEDTNLPYKIDSLLGYVKPFWIPDEQADICMYCDQKFTLVKRRHHCRACGKILCSNCCNKRLTLPSMDNKLCRVCIACFQLLENDPNTLSNAPCHKTDNILVTPDPSKPEQYCSKLPPLLQVSTNNELPVIYVPIYKQGILKNNNITSHNNVINHVNLTRESLSNNNNSNHKLSEMDVAQPSNIDNNNQFLNECYDQQTRPASFNKSINSIDGAVNKKQVMFSDGVRPGGDLSLLDDNAIKPSPSKSKLAPSRKNLIKGKKEKCLSSFVMPTVNHIPPLILKFSDGKLFAVNSSEITMAPETFNGNSKLIDFAPDKNYKLVICANLYLEICIEEILKGEEYVTKSNNNLITIICKTCGMQNVGLNEIFSCFSVPPPYNDSLNDDNIIKTSSKNNKNVIPHGTYNLLLDNYELFIKDFGYQIYQIYLNAIKGKGVSHLDFHAFKNFGKFKDKFWFEEPKKDCLNPTTTTFGKNGGSEQQNLAANLSIDSIYSGFLLVRPTKYSISHLLELLTSHKTQILKNIYDSNNPSYLAVLVHKWETPWAKLLPLRLLLRLGLQAQNYPYPVTSPVDRVSTFYEINHTIINLLADCRNFKYTLPRIPGLYLSYRNKCLTVTVAKKELRRNLRSNISSELSSISDHVLALAANFNPLARSHLVCVQNENDSHYTKQIFRAILPIPNNDCGVGQIPTTNESDEDNLGGTFIVFNGSLKACPPSSYTDGDYQLECQKSSKYIRKNSKIKISTVEDGFIVHVSPHDLNLIATALKESQDLVLGASTVFTTNISSKNVSHYQTQEPQRTQEIDNTLQLINDIDGNNLTNGQPSAPSATLIPAPLTPNRWSLEGEYYFDNENAYSRGCDDNLTVPSNIISLAGADGIFSSISAAGSVTAEADNSFKLIDDDVLQVQQQPPPLSSSSGNCFNLNALAQSLEDLSTTTTTTSPSKPPVPVPSFQPQNQNNNNDNKNTDHMFSNTKSSIFAHGNTDINLVYEPEEDALIIKWIDGHYDELESKYSRVKSLIDGLELQDAFNFKPLGYFIDYIKRHLYVRLVDIYYIKTDAILLAKHDTLDADQFAQDLSKAFCSCVVNRLELLTACNVKQINLRITLDSNKVGYELSPLGIHYQPYITEIDEYLIPIIHSALNYTADLGSLVIELVFHILKI